MLFAFFAVCGLLGIFMLIRRMLAADLAAFSQAEKEKGRLD